MARSDEQKLLMSPIEMTFGQTKYKIPPLKMGQAIEWRAKLAAALDPIVDNFQSTNGLVSKGLAEAITAFPEKMTDLILAYDQSHQLSRETIMNEGSEEQLVIAWSELLIVAYPFLTPLAVMMKVIRPTSSR